ncbi:MAG: dihydroorotate dehydrogenase electron transfer subunit [Verrucomicrobiota bacterium]|nr:dihydroorotate dehydrogenase electron transfer subunit [Verrucomicrobiota bacterium]
MQPRKQTPRLVRARVREHKALRGDYRFLALEFQAIGSLAQPGQFVHLRAPQLAARVLRRPFSIYSAKGNRLGILYKTVGQGTRALAEVAVGERVDVMGPLGRGFPTDRTGIVPVLVAGGYGVAPLSFLAGRLRVRGVVFVGGASARDVVLCVEDFRKLGWEVRTATEDGSRGIKGLITAPLDAWARKNRSQPLEFFACGPDGLLEAVGRLAAKGRWKAWLSLDKHMGCGLGACLACVQKVRDASGKETWARVCRDGPVFEAAEIVW